MADTKKIMEILKELQDYYRQDYNETQVRVLARQLAPVPEKLLRQVVDEYMDTESRWLPRGGHLLGMAKQNSGYTDFRSMPESEILPIRVQLQELKNVAYRNGIVDHDDWNRLVDFAQEMDLYFLKAAIKRAYQAVLNPQTEEECQAYAEWEEHQAGKINMRKRGKHNGMASV